MTYGRSATTWPGRTGRVLFVQHQDTCPPGHVGDRMAQRGAAVEVVDARAPRLPRPGQFDLIVPLGSYDSAHDDSVPYLRSEVDLLTEAVETGVRVFGICFGAQLLSRVLGGQVCSASEGPEIGWLEVDPPVARADAGPADASGRDLVPPGPWLVWHEDVMTPPPGSTELARTAVGTQAFVHGRHVGVQFHPEAKPASVRIWAHHYREAFREKGLDQASFLAESHRLAPAALRRGYALTDRVVDLV